jgi:3-phosphoshikimate 1-carboxyvinyltransferase
LAIAASQAQGVTQIKDAGELRVKESDRLKTVADGLKHLGAKVGETPDGLLIVGPSPLLGGRCSTQGDHRMAMAFAVAGLIAQGETIIDEADTVEVSYPSFFEHLKTLVTKD